MEEEETLIECADRVIEARHMQQAKYLHYLYRLGLQIDITDLQDGQKGL
jgi:hypothetical protein